MGATAPAPAEKKATTQKKGSFVILVRAKGTAEGWTQLSNPVSSVTSEDAKRVAARNLVEDDTYGPLIKGDGLEVAAVSVRSFKPVVVKVEPQPAKVVIG